MSILSELKESPDSTRVLRLAFGTTLSIAIAVGYGWPMSFLTPVFVIEILSKKVPCLSLADGIKLVLVMVICLFGAALTSSLLMPYPLLVLGLLALAFLWTFYLGAGGAPQFLILMMLIGLSIFPLLSSTSSALAIAGAGGMALCGIVTVIVVWISFALVPDTIHTQHEMDTEAKESPPPPFEQWSISLRSLLIVFPLVTLFLMLNMIAELLILVFVTILAQQPTAAAGVKAGAALILGNLGGGILAIFIFNLLVIMPSYGFLLVVSFAVCLLVGPKFFESKPSAQLWIMGTSTAFLLIISTTGVIGGEADASLVNRIWQIMLAAFYVVLSNLIYDYFQFRRRLRHKQRFVSVNGVD